MPPRTLTTAIIRFADTLRRHGLPVTLGQVADAARGLDHLDVADRGEIHLGLRTVLVGRPEDYPTYDQCFDQFWRAGFDAGPMSSDFPAMSLPDGHESTATVKSEGQQRETLALETWGEDEGTDAGEPLS